MHGGAITLRACGDRSDARIGAFWFAQGISLKEYGVRAKGRTVGHADHIRARGASTSHRAVGAALVQWAVLSGRMRATIVFLYAFDLIELNGAHVTG